MPSISAATTRISSTRPPDSTAAVPTATHSPSIMIPFQYTPAYASRIASIM